MNTYNKKDQTYTSREGKEKRKKEIQKKKKVTFFIYFFALLFDIIGPM
jgi:hypothetical protein